MRQTLRELWPYVWRRRRTFALGVLMLVLKDALGAVRPLVLRDGVDTVGGGLTTGGQVVNSLVWFLALLLVLSALKGVFQYHMRVLLIGVSRDLEYEIRNRLFDRLVRLDASFYARQRTGDIMARATNDLEAVRGMVGPGFMYWSETSLTFLFAFLVMMWTDWRLTLLALAPAPLVSVTVMYFGRWLHARHQEIQEKFSDMSSRVQESLAGLRVLRAYTQEQSEVRQFQQLNRDFVRRNLHLGVAQGLFMPLLETLIRLSFLIVLWIGGMRLLDGRITLGDFLMFNFYLGMLSWPMIALGWVVNLTQRGSASWKRLQGLMGEEPRIAAPEHPRQLAEPARGDIEFERVTVDYGGQRAISALSLQIPSGSVAALVGRTGSGKTTLANLVPRLLDPTSGVVRMDGVDLRELDPAALRARIGFVPQESFLFSATLAENIALGVPNASREAVARAASLAGLDPDLAAFPAGLDTMLGERGITLSGGQKQRTAIARAILRDPRVLVLDDALSAVDTDTEERLLANLSEVMRGRTTILIAHRVSTVRRADWIVVLDKGEIAEQGTHDELLTRDGFYADLCRKQALEEELEAI
jgi:ATP-binding cassette subfamily B protein